MQWTSFNNGFEPSFPWVYESCFPSIRSLVIYKSYTDMLCAMLVDALLALSFLFLFIFCLLYCKF